MSKQRPYGDFEEAYIDLMLNNAPKELDDLLIYLIYASNIDNEDYKNNENFIWFRLVLDDSDDNVFFPGIMFHHTEYLPALWICLCRMYGEVCGDGIVRNSPFTSYIPISNIKMTLDDLLYYIYRVWPYYD